MAFPRLLFVGPVAAPVQLGTGFQGDFNFQPGSSFVNNFLWLKGRHSLNIGWEFRRTSNTTTICEGCPARFVFSNRTTSLPGSSNFANFGHPFASFLLGIADGVDASTGLGRPRFPQRIILQLYSGRLQSNAQVDLESRPTA
ncbi:MAG: hypothetical protein WKF84_02580 [Pyrinomonadaceae bacterium]